MIIRRKKSYYQSIFIISILLLTLISLGATSAQAWDNCPFGEINESYPGTCGRYIDTDQDNICDLSQLPPAVRAQAENNENTDTTQNEQAASSANTSSSSARIQYYFIPIAALLFILYTLTYMLSKKKKIKRIQHRKTWNVLLLITFLVSSIFGIILALLISYEIRLSFYSDLLFWHVEFGIAMAMISFFHIGWHWNYYKRILQKKQETT